MVSVAFRAEGSARALPDGHPGHSGGVRREGSIGRTIAHAPIAAMAVATQNCQSPMGKLTRRLPRPGRR